MECYLLKVYFMTGESLSCHIDVTEDNPFPNLKADEYLYFDYSKFKEIFWDLIHPDAWYTFSLRANADYIINFLVFPIYPQVPGYIALTREEAATQAMNDDLSFRVVMENGITLLDHMGNPEARYIQVYLNDNVVYKAEVF